MPTTTITTTDEEVIIRISKKEFERIVHGVRPQQHAGTTKKVDWNVLRGLFADDSRFKGRTSVEVQHMLHEVWERKHSL